MSGAVRRVVTISALAIGLGACGAAPLAEFGALSQAGVSFTEQTPRLLERALADEIDRDSEELIAERDGAAGREAVLQSLEQRNAAFEDRAETYATVVAHAKTLGAFFVQLGRLADGSDDPAIGRAIDALADDLSAASGRVSGVQLQDGSISTLAGDVAPVLVGFARRGQLQSVLKDHSQTVLNAIALQRRIFVELNGIEADARRTADRQAMQTRVLAPFADDGDLPADWSRTRLALLTADAPPTPYHEAVVAADSLASNYRRLAAGQGTAAGIATLITDVQTLITAIEQPSPVGGGGP